MLCLRQMKTTSFQPTILMGWRVSSKGLAQGPVLRGWPTFVIDLFFYLVYVWDKSYITRENGMTEEQLLQKIYQAVVNTGVTYKQIECDLDEQGDMTIFFSGLDQENDDEG